MRVRFPHTVHVMFVTTGCSYQVWQSKGATPLPPTFENFVCLYFEQNVAECSKFYTAQLSTQHNFSEISQIITPPDPPPQQNCVPLPSCMSSKNYGCVFDGKCASQSYTSCSDWRPTFPLQWSVRRDLLQQVLKQQLGEDLESEEEDWYIQVQCIW